jgi:protein-tyrosine phosphatase
MNLCSYFIPDKALFGSYPTQDNIYILQNEGVRYFIDLTYYNEKNILPYKTDYNYIKYPIRDHSIPEDWKSFSILIIGICNILNSLKENEKIYIHCKGGHGRSGILVACIFCYYYKLDVDTALQKTKECHSKRPIMKDKWRKLGSPQNIIQKDFVKRFFEPFKYNKNIGIKIGFDIFSEHSINIKEKGYFENASRAIQYYKYNTKDWENNKLNYINEILKNKFSQHEDLKLNLLSTYMRPLIKVSLNNTKMYYSKILMKIRDLYFFELFNS